MRNVVSLAIFFTMILPFCASAQELTSEEFISAVRRGNTVETFGIMEGTIKHQRRGVESEEFPIFFAVMFRHNRTLAQLIVAGDEGYYVGQTRNPSGSYKPTVAPMNEDGYDSSILARFGVKPSDLAVSFIYYDVVRELEEESVKMVGCRVFELLSPAGDELVRAYIAKNYFFPMRAEFFGKNADGWTEKPLRTLDAISFVKDNDLYLVSKFKLYGPGWQTDVFFDTETRAGIIESQNPPDIFRTI